LVSINNKYSRIFMSFCYSVIDKNTNGNPPKTIVKDTNDKKTRLIYNSLIGIYFYDARSWKL